MVKSMNTKRIVQIDSETGEQIQGNVVLIPNRNSKMSNFFMMNRELCCAIADRTLNLSLNEIRVLMALIGLADFGNEVLITQREIGSLVGLDKAVVSRVFKQLRVKKLILPVEKIGVVIRYRINSEIGWRGSTATGYLECCTNDPPLFTVH